MKTLSYRRKSVVSKECLVFLDLDTNGLKDLVSELQALKPDYVAFVVQPELIEDNFVGAVFAGLTALDNDPYLDCAYGYITGATPQDALRLVHNTAAAQAQPNSIPKKFVAIGHTFAQNDLSAFAIQRANRYKAYGYQTASSSWQNVAFAITKFFNKGRSLGEAFQESLNDKLRDADIKNFRIVPFQDGRRSPQFLSEKENPGGIQSISRVILIGDPAYRPFPRKPVRVPSISQSRNYDSLPPRQRRLRRLIEELSDPDAPRFRALNEIIRIGSAAVPVLIAEMKTNDNCQIPKALGTIGDKRAIEPLIGKLELSDWSPMREVVSEALESLTGKDFGTDAKDWKIWWEKEQQRKE